MRRNRQNNRKIIGEIVKWIAGGLFSGGIMYVSTPYFLAGVRAERGYDAIGGEYILIVILFVAITLGFKSIFDYMTD